MSKLYLVNALLLGVLEVTVSFIFTLLSLLIVTTYLSYNKWIMYKKVKDEGKNVIKLFVEPAALATDESAIEG